MYVKKLVSDRIYLSPMNPDDYKKFTVWVNDPKIGIYVDFLSNTYSYNREKSVMEELAKGNTVFVIVDKTNDSAIGVISLMNVNQINRKAELGIFIGDSDYHSKGYGSEAIKLLLDYSFNVLNMHNVMLRVKAFNERAITCYKKCGFVEFGRRREANIYGDKKFDTIYMDILNTEFKGKSYVDDLVK